MIGLGTVAVREYIEELRELEIKAAAVAPAHIDTMGPHGAFGAVLYIEKEGFMALMDEAKLAQRFDLAIMSSKGMSVVAARELADEVCHAWRVPLFILRDFDKAGFSIRAGFMQQAVAPLHLQEPDQGPRSRTAHGRCPRSDRAGPR